MQEYPDNDQPHEGLDGLFRKSAEEFEPTFDPAAWQDMRARLEEHDRKVLMNKWLVRSSILLAVLLLGFVGWYSWEVLNAGGASVRQQPGQPTRAQHQPDRAEPMTPENKPAATDPAVTPGARVATETARPPQAAATGVAGNEGRRIPEATKIVLPQTDQNSTSGAATSQVVTRHQSVGNSNTSNQSIRLTAQPPARLADRSGKRRTPAGLAVDEQQAAVSQTADAPVNRSPVAVTDQTPATDKPVAAVAFPGRRAGTVANPDFDPASEGPVRVTGLDSAAVAEAGAMPVWQDVARLRSHSFVWPVFTSALYHPVAAPDVEKPAATTRPKVRGFSLRAMVSPDLTTIGLHDFVRPGTNLGLLVEYRLSSRWSVQAGAMWSKKVYEAYPDQYVWPTNWKWQVPVLGVDGVCSMIDIPLNVRYDVVLQPRKSGLTPSRWFVNTGATSFVMLREVYDYQYENPNDPRIKFKQWAGKTGTYSLSHLNFSVGYERAWTKRWSWQIEPFIKTPLQGVGRFKVNLISTGTFLSIRYKL